MPYQASTANRNEMLLGISIPWLWAYNKTIESEYSITDKIEMAGNTQDNYIINIIHYVLGNTVQICKFQENYVKIYDPMEGHSINSRFFNIIYVPYTPLTWALG